MTKRSNKPYWNVIKKTTYAIGRTIVGALQSGTQTPYQQYIQSDAWKQRAMQEKKANPNCSLCNRRGTLHAHHRTYVRLGNERHGDLTVLCDDCHEMFHKRYTYESTTGCFIPNKQAKIKVKNNSIGRKRRKIR